jgi:putative ABC transport system permease protein
MYAPASLRVRTLSDAASEDQVYQTTRRPTGLIFGFGVIMGLVVGLIIVYQILSTDVAEHIREYATFKAMGYASGFFVGVVLEEAILLAILGFVPGFTLSVLIYKGLAAKTGLPLAMSSMRAVAVFTGTVAASALSGALATRKLGASDPADLF